MPEEVAKLLRDFRRTKTYDVVAAVPLIAWYLFGLSRQAPLTWLRLQQMVRGDIGLLDLLQGFALLGSLFLVFLLVILLLIRKTPGVRSRGALPRAVALMGAFLGNGFLYLKAVTLTLPVQVLADLLIAAGALGSLIAVSRLGGSFSMLPEARGLVTTGPYALVRHPLYLAEMIGVLGLVLQFQQPWSILLGAGVFVLQYWRSIFEERILTEAYPDYAIYQARTWRFVPYVF